MTSYQRLLSSILLFIGAWFCLFNAAIQLPINSQDLSDSEGLSVVVLLTIALVCLGLPGSALTIAGVFFSALIKPKSLIVRRWIFWVSNLLLLLSSLFGILVIGLFALDTLLSIVGISLFISVIALILSATPKRIADKNQE
ncbi:hypothetical protein [Pseudomonas sp. NFX224]|uniref:hypothetical protein n=1 Tax=Pseudomonas sp. NFX224 TaxID=3402862 RepID=UPI003AFA0A5D